MFFFLLQCLILVAAPLVSCGGRAAVVRAVVKGSDKGQREIEGSVEGREELRKTERQGEGHRG